MDRDIKGGGAQEGLEDELVDGMEADAVAALLAAADAEEPGAPAEK